MPAPIINDISTDLENVPQFVGNTKLNPLPEEFKPQIADYYKDLGPLVTEASKDAAFQACQRAAKHMPRWKISLEDENSGIIEGFATTLLLRFKDDFVIRIAEKDGATCIDMRSKSRTGKGDLGANAARIKEYFAKVKEELK